MGDMIELALVLVPRLIFLRSLPIFNDEAIFLHWAYLWLQNPSHWWISLVLGSRQPGLTILLGLTQLLPLDPLLSARLVGPMCGTITYLALSRFDRQRNQTHSRLPLALLVGFSPYLLFFDRIALTESVVTMLASTAMVLAYHLLQKKSTSKSIILGLVLGIGWWMKSTMLLVAVPIALAFFLRYLTDKKERLQLLVSLTIAAGVAAVLVVPMQFHPLVHKASVSEGSIFLLTRDEFLSITAAARLDTGLTIIQWLLGYLTPIAVGLSAYAVYKRPRSAKVQYLLLFAILPIVLGSLSARLLTARYLIVSVPAILLLTHEGLSLLAGTGRNIVGVLLFGWMIFASGLLVTSPLSFYRYLGLFPKAQMDVSQYVTSWPSGYGVIEAIRFIENEATKHPAIVFIRLDAGNPESALAAYLPRHDIPVLTTARLPEVLAHKKELEESGAVLYFVSRGLQRAGLEDRLVEIARFNKPLDSEYVGVYRIDITKK